MNQPWPMLPETTRAIGALDHAVAELNRRLPQPYLKDDWFQYPEEAHGPEIVVLTRLIRLVSGLRAVKILGERGFLQEMGVLLRTIDDFCDEVTFLIEGHAEGATSGQATKHVKLFFAERMLSKDELLRRGKGPNRVKRAKIRAGQSRFLRPENPSDVQAKVAAIDHVFDAFVHGAYPAVMELYRGDTHTFQTDGMANTPNLTAMRHQFLYYVSRSLAVTTVAAFTYGFDDLGEALKAANRRFCESSEYPGRTSG